jgi:tetratricopeptide (TPR) repeat protein
LARAGVIGAILVAVGGILFLAIQWVGAPPTYPVAGDGETLIVVGRFVNYVGGSSGYNVAGRVQEALERELEAARLPGARVGLWPEEIRDQGAAEAVGQRARAAVVIWGEYDSGRVLTRFTIPEVYSGADERQWEELVASPSDLSATINSTLPGEVRYVALLTLGQLYADGEDFDRARAVLDQAIARPPAEPEALATLYFYLGYVYQVGESANLDQAIHYYSQALALNPESTAAYHNRGVAYLGLGRSADLGQAIEDLTRVIAARPDDAAAYTNRGVAYLTRDGPNDVARALEDLSRAIELAPDAPKAYINRAAAYLQRNQAGDGARVIEDSSRAIELMPEAPGPYLNRGLAYLQAGQRDEWLADFERVLTLEPDHAGAYNALCWAYALDRQPELALPYCEQAVILDPSGYSHDSRGVVYAELGRLEEAAGEFEIFLDWLRGQPESLYRRHGPTREEWLGALKAGRNPIGPETLEQLRRE